MKTITYSATILGTIFVEDWRDELEILSLIEEDLEDRDVFLKEINNIEFDEH